MTCVACNSTKCPNTSDNVAHATGSASATKRCLPWSDDHEHVTLPEQHPAAGRAVTADLAGQQPSINCSYIDAAQPSDLTFRQKRLVIGVF